MGGALLAVDSVDQRRANVRQVNYATTMVPAAEAVSIELDNVSEGRAMILSLGA